MKRWLAAIAASIAVAMPALGQQLQSGWLPGSVIGVWIDVRPGVRVDADPFFDVVRKGGPLMFDQITMACGSPYFDGHPECGGKFWAYVVITNLAPCMHVELRPPARVVLGKTMKILDEYDATGRRTWALVPDPQGPGSARISLWFENRCDVS